MLHNTLDDFIRVLKNHKIDFESVLEIGSRDGKDADSLKQAFSIKDCNVHIIEPNDNLYNIIKENLPQYNTHELAFSDKEGTSEFYQVNTPRDDLNGLSSLLNRNIYKNPILDVKIREVKTTTAKKFIVDNNLKNIIVKLDVEGLSFEVIKGFDGYFDEVKAIHLESEEYQIWEKQKTTHDIYNLLTNNFIRVKKTIVETEEERYIQYDEFWINKNCFKYTIDNYFNKVFYINLDADTTRNQYLLNQFNKYNIHNIERISGTIVKDVPELYYWRNFNVEFITKKYITGSIGARNAHWRIMELSIKRGYERILILEDDVLIHQDPNHILDINKNSLDRWDMLYFGGLVENHFGGQIVCAHAYAVYRKIMEEAYYMLQSSGMEVDNFYAQSLKVSDNTNLILT